MTRSTKSRPTAATVGPGWNRVTQLISISMSIAYSTAPVKGDRFRKLRHNLFGWRVLVLVEVKHG